jgi:hypothetical protein
MQYFRLVYNSQLLSARNTTKLFSQSASAMNDFNATQGFEWQTVKVSDTLVDRKSKFIGHACHTGDTKKVRSLQRCEV